MDNGAWTLKEWDCSFNCAAALRSAGPSIDEGIITGLLRCADQEREGGQGGSLMSDGVG